MTMFAQWGRGAGGAEAVHEITTVRALDTTGGAHGNFKARCVTLFTVSHGSVQIDDGHVTVISETGKRIISYHVMP